MDYITNLKESKSESQYGLISVYNMILRIYGKETAHLLYTPENELAKERYHKHILKLYQTAKNKGWYKNSLTAIKAKAAYAGDTNLNMKYSKWWLKKQVTKYDPVETIMFVSEKA